VRQLRLVQRELLLDQSWNGGINAPYDIERGRRTRGLFRFGPQDCAAAIVGRGSGMLAHRPYRRSAIMLDNDNPKTPVQPKRAA
jgi:hypothetical protein